MYRETSKPNNSGGFNVGKFINGIRNYNNAADSLPKKTYTDGWEEQKTKEIEETSKNSEVVTPEGNHMTKDDAEDFISNNGEKSP